MMKKKYYFVFNEGSRINQVICAIFINLTVFIYGTSIGWMSPMTLLLQSKDSPRGEPLSDSDVSWMAAGAYLLCIPGDLFMAVLGDKFGRKFAIIFLSSVAIICWAIKLASMDIWAFILARTLFGILMAGAYVTCPLYTKEISEDVIRGMLGSMVSGGKNLPPIYPLIVKVILFHTIGNLFLYIIGDVLSHKYNTILWICIALPIIHLFLFTLMPESPSYLVKKGKIEKAIKSLAWLRCRREDDIKVLNEIDLLKKEQSKDEESSKFVLKAILTDKIMFRAFKIAIVVALAREVCGTIPVLNFAGEIFSIASEGTSLILTPNQQAMMLGAVQVIGSASTFGVIERFGRKILLTITALISGMSMCVLASWFLARDYDFMWPAWLPIVTLCLCIFCDAFGLQPLSVVIISELFTFKYRGTVTALSMALASLTDFLQMLFFKPIVKSIGPYAAFYFFGAVCILAAIYTIIAIPETKARNLEEIYEDLKTKKEKRKEVKTTETISKDIIL